MTTLVRAALVGVVAAALAGTAVVRGAAAQPAATATAAHRSALKKTISVDAFSVDGAGGAVSADGMTALLTEALVNDGRFIVVERPSLAAVQAEQTLGSTKATTDETAARTGKLIGSSALVKGAVTQFSNSASGGGLTLGGVAGSASLQRQTAIVAISLRVIDTTTGQVVGAYKAEGRAPSTTAQAQVTLPSGANFGSTAFKNTPIGKAAEAAVGKAVGQIAAAMEAVPWSALVVDNQGGEIYVDAGTNADLKPGAQFVVWRKTGELTDPATGELLKVLMKKIGVIEIESVETKISTAKLVSGDAPARGDVLKEP